VAGDRAAALATLEAGHQARPGDPAVAQLLARLLIQDPETRPRGQILLADLARSALHPSPKEALARAQAAGGDKASALVTSEDAIGLATQLADLRWIELTRETRARIEASTLAEDPWPPELIDLVTQTGPN
jgi:hypothetical protein